jgi:plasmid maintenance system antidote protein VapI
MQIDPRKIRVALAEREMREYELAVKAKMAPATLSGVLNGHRTITEDEVARLAKVLGVESAALRRAP